MTSHISSRLPPPPPPPPPPLSPPFPTPPNLAVSAHSSHAVAESLPPLPRRRPGADLEREQLRRRRLLPCGCGGERRGGLVQPGAGADGGGGGLLLVGPRRCLLRNGPEKRQHQPLGPEHPALPLRHPPRPRKCRLATHQTKQTYSATIKYHKSRRTAELFAPTNDRLSLHHISDRLFPFLQILPFCLFLPRFFPLPFPHSCRCGRT